MEVVDQVMIIYAGNTGCLDEVPIKDVLRWEAAFLRYMRDNKASVRNAIVEKKELTDDLKAQLRAAIDEFKAWDRSQTNK